MMKIDFHSDDSVEAGCFHYQHISLKLAFKEKWSDEKYSLGKPLYAAIADAGKVSRTDVTSDSHHPQNLCIQAQNPKK